MKKNSFSIIITIIISIILSSSAVFAQEGITKFERWLAVGELHNWFSSIGCEREEDGFEKQQQAGWRWPAPYLNQDQQAAKGLWIGARNYTEPELGTTFDYKVVHCGPRPQTGGIDKEFFPMRFDHVAKFNPTDVLVDGEVTFSVTNTVDFEDENLPYDQVLYNTVNTQMGITMKRKIFQYSREYYNNFIVIEYTFINTGNIDKDPEIERTSGTIEDAYFYYQYRLAPCRETRILFGDPTAWGRNTLNDERGPYRSDADNPENLRYQYAWHGYFQDFNKWNNVGGPIWEPDDGFGARIDEADSVGRLGSAQFPGVLTLHADKSVTDRSDDTEQPRTTGYTDSDGQYAFESNTFNPSEMQARYGLMTRGHPAQSHAEFITNGDFAGSKENPAKESANNAGYSFVNGYGPYTIPYGDSIKIVMVEASAGLSRDEAIRIGKLYKNGEIDEVAKNVQVLTGKDSLHQTFLRALDAYQNDWKIADPPYPPKNFVVTSRGGRIDLDWDVYLEDPYGFPEGFEIYRSTIDPVDGYASNAYYSKHELVASLPSDARSFSDTAIALNTAYYYYIVSLGAQDAGNPSLGIPPHTLKSGRFYTQTYAPAYKRKPGLPTITSAVRVVPNPYIISAGGSLLYPNEENKIVFLNISGQCTINIYTELGELIQTIEHTDGSGSQDWFLTTSSSQILVSGIYIAVITDDITGDREIVKFTIIR